jgi:hypothetical protein
MKAIAQVLIASGVGPGRAWWEVVKAALTLNSLRRRSRREVLVAQRKEVCEVKDHIIEFIQHYRETGNALTAAVGTRQLMEALYHREYPSRALALALKELLGAGHLRRTDKQLPEPVYSLGPRRYFSKTSLLSAQLQKMGVFDRALREQRPYDESPKFKV